MVPASTRRLEVSASTSMPKASASIINGSVCNSRTLRASFAISIVRRTLPSAGSTTWAAEAGLQIPVYRSVDERPETAWGLVLGLRGANAREVVEGVRSKLEELKPALPDGVEVAVFYDRGRLVDRAVATVNRALLEAIVLVLVLLSFLTLRRGDGHWSGAGMRLPLAAMIATPVESRPPRLGWVWESGWLLRWCSRSPAG